MVAADKVDESTAFHPKRTRFSLGLTIFPALLSTPPDATIELQQSRRLFQHSKRDYYAGSIIRVAVVAVHCIRQIGCVFMIVRNSL